MRVVSALEDPGLAPVLAEVGDGRAAHHALHAETGVGTVSRPAKGGGGGGGGGGRVVQSPVAVEGNPHLHLLVTKQAFKLQKSFIVDRISECTYSQFRSSAGRRRAHFRAEAPLLASLQKIEGTKNPASLNVRHEQQSHVLKHGIKSTLPSNFPVRFFATLFCGI